MWCWYIWTSGEANWEREPGQGSRRCANGCREQEAAMAGSKTKPCWWYAGSHESFTGAWQVWIPTLSSDSLAFSLRAVLLCHMIILPCWAIISSRLESTVAGLARSGNLLALFTWHLWHCKYWYVGGLSSMSLVWATVLHAATQKRTIINLWCRAKNLTAFLQVRRGFDSNWHGRSSFLGLLQSDSKHSPVHLDLISSAPVLDKSLDKLPQIEPLDTVILSDGCLDTPCCCNFNLGGDKYWLKPINLWFLPICRWRRWRIELPWARTGETRGCKRSFAESQHRCRQGEG